MARFDRDMMEELREKTRLVGELVWLMEDVMAENRVLNEKIDFLLGESTVLERKGRRYLVVGKFVDAEEEPELFERGEMLIRERKSDPDGSGAKDMEGGRKKG